MNKVFQKYPHLKSTKKAIGQLERKAKQSKYGKPVITAFIIFLLIVGAILGYKFIPRTEINEQFKEIGNSFNINKNVDDKKIGEASVVPTIKTLTPITGENDEIPMADTLYLLKDTDGFYSLFITNPEMNKYFDEALQAEQNSPYHGYLGQGKYKQAEGVDYREYVEKIRLIKLPAGYLLDSTFSFADFNILADNSKILISFIHSKSADVITEGEDPPQYNSLLEIDLKTKKSDFFWIRTINDEKYGEFLGAVTFKDVIEKYMVGGVSECYNCGISQESMLIINTENGKDLLLGVVENLSFEMEKKLISYDDSGVRMEQKLP